MDSAVGHLPPVYPGLCVQVVLKLAVYVVDDGLPAARRQSQVGNGGRLIAVEEARRGGLYQLLLSTASPKPGVSTIVSSSWTPPSFTKTLACST